MINRNCKRRFVVILVVTDHLRELQLFTKFFTHRHANKPFSMYRHKIHVFSSGELGGTNKITFVFPVFIVCNQDDFPLLQFF
ncbi:hypothetical protein SDC9_200145 [bioreactor metagenome]|uniref:Uncharacterized protein n=1 Tax=bioreactor metagenome TaxID=1076179 RepID=A0A645IZ54_9ZZZZ